MLDEIKRIAKEVRNNAVSVLTKPKYGFREDLHGACGICSMALKKSIVKELKIKPSVVYGYFDYLGHCWVEFEGSIIDITATQFKVREKVLVTDIMDKRYNWDQIIENYDDFEDWQHPYKPTPHKVKRVAL